MLYYKKLYLKGQNMKAVKNSSQKEVLKSIECREIKESDMKDIVIKFGEKILKYNMVNFSKENFNLGVFSDDKIVGLICVGVTSVISPLQEKDAFLLYGEIDEKFRNRGLATMLIKSAEQWAKDKKLFQIRGWSGQDKIEAIHLLKKLGYGMCPSIMYDKKYLPSETQPYVVGYNYAKRLD